MDEMKRIINRDDSCEELNCFSFSSSTGNLEDKDSLNK